MGATRPAEVEPESQRGRRNRTLNQSYSSHSSINRTRTTRSQQSQQSQQSTQEGQRGIRGKRHRIQEVEESENSDSDEEEADSTQTNRRRPAPSMKNRHQRRLVSSESKESDSDSKLTKSTGKGGTKFQPRKIRRPELSEGEEDSLVDEYVKKGVSYLWFTLSKNAAVKRADFTRTIFQEDKRLYNRVVSEIQKHLKDVFGMNLLSYNEQTHQASDDIAGQHFHCLIMTSTLKVVAVMERHVYFHSRLGLDIREYKKDSTIRALLFMYLGLIFMKGLELGVDEQSMWHIIETMKFSELIGVQQTDFRKFLKTEYVSTLYLTLKESKDDQGVLINVHYYWGPRSHLEYSKWDIFRHVVSMLPGNKKTLDFPAQMQIILNSSEKLRAIEETNKEPESPTPSRQARQGQDDSNDSDSDDLEDPDAYRANRPSDIQTTESD